MSSLDQSLNNKFAKLRQAKKNTSPTSKYFGIIGSTTCEDIPYELQLEVKLKALKLVFKDILPAELLNNYQITASPKINEYRLKMDFVCAYNPMFEPHSRFGQRKKGNFSWVVDMDECNLISEKWFKKIRSIYDFLQEQGLRNYDLKKHDGELRYIVSKIYEDEAMIIIITKSESNPEVIEKAANKALELGFKSVYWQKQEGLGDVSFGETVKNWGENYINIKLGKITFQVGPNTFFQNNVYAFEEILKFVSNYLNNKNEYTLYDLYCGVGTIGLNLADKVQKVIGIDVVTESIESAKNNALTNKISNAEFHTIDLSKEGDIPECRLPIAIVDPPRVGLGDNGVNELLNLKPEEIIYISCNPTTQAIDVKKLIDAGYKIKEAKGFDMFPHTNHVENVVVLSK